MNIDAFLLETHAQLTKGIHGVKIVARWVAIEDIERWAAENEKTVAYIQAEAWDYGMRADPATREHEGKTSHYLKFEKVEQ